MNYPIHLNGKHINTVQALWTKKPSEITEDLYNKFYKYISKRLAAYTLLCIPRQIHARFRV